MAKGGGGGYGVTRELTPTSAVFCRARVGQPNLPPSVPVIRPRFTRTMHLWCYLLLCCCAPENLKDTDVAHVCTCFKIVLISIWAVDGL